MEQPLNDKQHEEHPPKIGAGRVFRFIPRTIATILAIFLSFLVFLVIASYFLDEPLRRNLEKKLNQGMKGYTARVGGAHLNLIGLAFSVTDLTLSQQKNPDPPLMKFEKLKASVHWSALLRGKLVGDLVLVRPRVDVNLAHVRNEAADPVKVKDRGWQQGVTAIYPLKINEFRIREGEITYTDRDPARRIRLSKLNLLATNLRNVSLPDKVHPSSFRLETVVFDQGRLVVDGKGNFLAEPHPALDAGFRLEKMALAPLEQVAAHAHMTLDKGVLEASGRLRFGNDIRHLSVTNLTVSGMELLYRLSEPTPRKEKVKKEASKMVSQAPPLKLTIGLFSLKDCTLGIVNRSDANRYRVFISDTDFHLADFSNNFADGPSRARLEGKFMGAGAIVGNAEFRPEKNGPDFDLRVKIERTPLTKLNDIFRAYGAFDVSGGMFQLYSEISIRNSSISGYVKPLFKNVDVYDRRKDKEKKLFSELYEMLVGGVAKLLENQPRDQVATRVDVSGRVDRPRTSTWQVLTQLVRNAFFKAILPGFEKEVTRQAEG